MAPIPGPPFIKPPAQRLCAANLDAGSQRISQGDVGRCPTRHEVDGVEVGPFRPRNRPMDVSEAAIRKPFAGLERTVPAHAARRILVRQRARNDADEDGA